MLFQILRVPEANLFTHLPKTQYQIARKCIIECILATDMEKHRELMDKFDKIVPTFDFKNLEHKTLVSAFEDVSAY
jgi:high affinity cGMP-specific 3',5'-cyclic phosphodiesterase 9